MADTLTAGQKLVNGESLTAGNGAYTLTLHDDGNLVHYSADGPAWSTKTETDAPPPEAEAEVAPAAAEETAAPEPEPEPAARTYTVVSGDTLWAIAERFYGDGNKYQQIADASGISNPDLIQPGQALTIPRS
ncbi:LysM peptidoglycan-binding domain-containing protein [Mycobacterium sp.]|uniref:LysM peptidoglycan-binding domain-containing protein n=1 Tax=Mycobacterium sp. TaxID=1785 RepID=UPI0031CF3FBC